MLPDMAVAAKGEVRSILVLAKKPIEFAQAHRAGHQFAQFRRADAPALPRPVEHRAGIRRRAARSRSHAGRGRCRAGDRRSGAARAPQSGRTRCQAARRRTAVAAAMQSEQPVPGVDTLFVYDVAQQWREMTGKPCVLAVWAGRRDVVTPEVVADFLASRALRPRAIGRHRRRRGAEARIAAGCRWSATCARTSISRSTPKISPAWNYYFDALRRRRTDSRATRPIEFARHAAEARQHAARKAKDGLKPWD